MTKNSLTSITPKILRPAKFWITSSYNLYIARKTPIIVYQMGRVGSVSIHSALEKQGLFSFHVHMLNPQWFAPELNKPRSWKWVYEHIISKQRPVKLISVVRNPIEVKISAFFKNLDRIMGKPMAHTAFSIDELIAAFHRTEGKGDFQFRWFDEQVRDVVGIDVFETPFPTEIGYQTYQHGNVDLLIVRSELADEVKGRAIAEFLGLPSLELRRLNRSNDHSYAKVRQQFDAEIKLNPEPLDTWLSSRLVQHFFSVTEIEEIRQKWSR